MGRRSWLITHSNNGVYLSFDMFRSSQTFFSIDECHYTFDAAVVYTYLHFKDAVAVDAITKFMEQMRIDHNLILFEIFGYESIVGSSRDVELTDHVAFKMLLSHYQTNHPSFRACTNGKPVVNGGMLWRCDAVSRIRELATQRSKFLGSAFADMERELADSREKSQMIDLLRAQVAQYEERMELYREKIKELGRFQFICHVLRSRVEDLDPKIQEYVFDVDHRGRPLFPT